MLLDGILVCTRTLCESIREVEHRTLKFHRVLPETQATVKNNRRMYHGEKEKNIASRLRTDACTNPHTHAPHGSHPPTLRLPSPRAARLALLQGSHQRQSASSLVFLQRSLQIDGGGGSGREGARHE